MFRRLTAVMALVGMLIALSSCTELKNMGGNGGTSNNQTTKQANESGTLGNASGSTASDSGTTGNGSGETTSGNGTSTVNDKDISGLKSFHSVLKLTLKGKTKEEDQTTRIEQYNVKEPLAKHMIYSSTIIDKTFQVMMEMIIIEKDTWLKMVNGPWMKQSADAQENAMFKENLFDLNTVKTNDLVRAGEEKISGIDCIHYTFKGTYYDSSVDGEFWIANENNIKNIVVKENILSSATYQGETMTTYMEYMMDQINENIKIEPPKDVQDFSGSSVEETQSSAEETQSTSAEETQSSSEETQSSEEETTAAAE